MKNKHNKLTCLFGHHDYSKTLTMDKHGRSVHFCKICKRAAYRDGVPYEWPKFRRWYEYNEYGTCIYIKFSNGEELIRGVDGFWNGKK